jgi:predicted membrane chloride channel (bestrophin family)
MKRWRAHLRVIAILVNSLFALWLLMVRGWWMPIAYLGGAPFIIPPVVAIIALILTRTNEHGL